MIFNGFGLPRNLIGPNVSRVDETSLPRPDGAERGLRD